MLQHLRTLEYSQVKHDIVYYNSYEEGSCPDDIPLEAHGEREWLKEHPFRPLLFVPMTLRGSLYGAIGFYGEEGEERDWPEVFVTLLKFAADLFVNALERKHVEEEREGLIADLERETRRWNDLPTPSPTTSKVR